jgi:hypothetical protein
VIKNECCEVSLFLITFLLLFSTILLPASFEEVFDIALKKGWNSVSIPYETFNIVRIEGKVNPIAYA